jgi:hypothetical protein
MLKTSTIGLPYFVEADNKEHSLDDIYSQFYKSGPEIKTLIVNNVTKEDMQPIGKKLGNRIFLSKIYNGINPCYSYLSNQVKRRLPLAIRTIEIKEILLVSHCYTSYDWYPRKGVSLAQFKKEVYNKDYRYVGLGIRGGVNFFHNNLRELGFTPVVDSPLLGIFSSLRFTLYAKEEL